MRTTLAILSALTLVGCTADPSPVDETEAGISSDFGPTVKAC